MHLPIASERVENFLCHVGHQINTEENALVIMDEFRDHIQSTLLDFIEMGYSESEATDKALHHFGDPTEIGMAFNDPKLAFRRAFLFWLYRGLGFVFILLSLSIVVLSTIDLSSPLVIGRPSLIHFFTSPNQFSNIFNCIYFLSIGGYLNYRATAKVSWLGFKLRPLLILWPVRKRMAWDWIWFTVGVMFGLPAMAIYLMPAYVEGLNLKVFLVEMLFLTLILLSIKALKLSEKQRLPKAIIVSEGFVVKDSFISWTAIDAVSWTKHTIGEAHYYKLILKNNAYKPIAAAIEINPKQKRYVEGLIHTHLHQTPRRGAAK